MSGDQFGPVPWAIAQDDCWPGTAKVIEECGELVQVLAKLIALGRDGTHWDGSDIRPRVMEEVADVTAALQFFVARNLSPGEERAVHARAEAKEAQFERWHEERKPAAYQARAVHCPGCAAAAPHVWSCCGMPHDGPHYQGCAHWVES